MRATMSEIIFHQIASVHTNIAKNFETKIFILACIHSVVRHCSLRVRIVRNTSMRSLSFSSLIFVACWAHSPSSWIISLLNRAYAFWFYLRDTQSQCIDSGCSCDVMWWGQFQYRWQYVLQTKMKRDSEEERIQVDRRIHTHHNYYYHSCLVRKVFNLQELIVCNLPIRW